MPPQARLRIAARLPQPMRSMSRNPRGENCPQPTPRELYDLHRRVTRHGRQRDPGGCRPDSLSWSSDQERRLRLTFLADPDARVVHQGFLHQRLRPAETYTADSPPLV
jgi:hypothetical protein